MEKNMHISEIIVNNVIATFSPFLAPGGLKTPVGAGCGI
jgi:hypothetical protein